MALPSRHVDSHMDTPQGMTFPCRYLTHRLIGNRGGIREKERAVSSQQQKETTTWEQGIQDHLQNPQMPKDWNRCVP